MVETELAPKLATNTVLPSGVSARPWGFVPVGMSVPTFVLVATSIVEIVLSSALAADPKPVVNRTTST